ncbi:MAG: hypothetical protein K2X53_04525 [Alphaproteobacteria bacterium]|nr:hypothetical protein [Alphaproteobacteria bacterium]
MRRILLTSAVFLSLSSQVFAKNCPSAEDVAVILKEFLTTNQDKLGQDVVKHSKSFVPQYQLQEVEDPSLLMEMDKVNLRQRDHGDKIVCSYDHGQYGMFSFLMKK